LQGYNNSFIISPTVSSSAICWSRLIFIKLKFEILKNTNIYIPNSIRQYSTTIKYPLLS